MLEPFLGEKMTPSSSLAIELRFSLSSSSWSWRVERRGAAITEASKGKRIANLVSISKECEE